MQYSTLAVNKTSRDVVDVFGGYNHNYRIGDGEFYDMRNMTSTYYPVLSTREPRGEFELGIGEHKANGMISKDVLCYVDGTSLYIDYRKVDGLELEDSKKQLISMGAYIIIMPDRKYVNTADLSDYGDIEAEFITKGNVIFEMCNADGEVYKDLNVSSTEPVNAVNKMLWLDTSESKHVLKIYSSVTLMWTQVATTYVKISSKNIASKFNRYDGVKITGIANELGQPAELNDQTSLIYAAYHDKGTDSRPEGANDYIVVVGLIDDTTYQRTPVTIKREMPKLDFIIESNNRLWGCRYGTNNDGAIVNEIYASKLGDFKNWNCFMGISTDSYIASCGTDGTFTGAVTHLGYPLFFKENALHKVYGNFPSNYQVQTTPCRGVMRGAGNSLAIVNEVLFYKSRNGVCAYDGSLPDEISYAFGDVSYSAVDYENEDNLRNGAVAGSHGNKYYISVKSEQDDKWHLFTYDASKRLWHKYDNIKVESFCSHKNQLYFIEGNKIKTTFGNTEKPFDWMVETGLISAGLPQKKYISQLLIRMITDVNAIARVYIQYDSLGEWESVAEVNGTNLKTHTLPIRPKRCDHFRLRISGVGETKILSISKAIESGSEVSLWN